MQVTNTSRFVIAIGDELLKSQQTTTVDEKLKDRIKPLIDNGWIKTLESGSTKKAKDE